MIRKNHVGFLGEETVATPSPYPAKAHFVRNLMTRVPKPAQTLVATLVRSIFAQPDQEAVWAQHGRIIEQLQERFAGAAQLLAEAGPDVLAFATFSREHWRQIWSNNPQERLNK